MKRISPQKKALKYLISKGWEFDDNADSSKDLKRALGNGERVRLADAVRYLLTYGWRISSLSDIENLDKARKIYKRSIK